MDEFETPHIESKLLGIRKTLERLGDSITDEENSLISSSLHKNSSFENADSYFQWNSYAALPEQDSKPDLQSKLLEYQSQEDTLAKSLQIKSEEIFFLKSRLKSFESLLLQREGQISKLIQEKESFFEAEEQMQLTLQELIKENKELKELNEISEIEKDQLQRELRESLVIIEKLRKTLKFKEDAMNELSQRKTNLEREMASSNQFFKSGFDSPQKFGLTDRKEGSFKVTCLEGMKIVGVTSIEDFQGKLIHLRQCHSKYKKTKRLVDRISDMIIQCSPTGSFQREPSSHQIWKWITSLVEEYMKLKKSTNIQSLQKLLQMTGASDIDNLLLKMTNSLKL